MRQLNEVERHILDEINRLENGEGPLWAVLSALRGPDILEGLPELSTYTIKVATTAVIRHYAMPNVGAVTMCNKDETLFVNIRAQLEAVAGGSTMHPWFHFFSHAKKAFEALGLKWNETNISDMP